LALGLDNVVDKFLEFKHIKSTDIVHVQNDRFRQIAFCALLARSRRPHHTRFVSYYDKAVPTEPDTAAVRILQKKRVSPAAVDEIKKVWNIA